MTPDHAATIYLDDCRARHLVDETVRGREAELKRFAFWCGCVHLDDLRDATAETLTDYRRWLGTRKRPDGKPISVQYANSQARTVHAMFRLLAERNRLMTDITSGLPPLRDPRRLPRGIMTPDEVMRLLGQPLMTTPLGFRDRAILELLYSTGLRAGECCRVTLYDLDLTGRTLRVIGKGNKERVVPVGKVAAGYVGEYIKHVRPILADTDRPNSVVYLTATGRAMLPADLGRLLRGYRESAGLPDTITVHSLRHTCATVMLRGGASIRHVQQMLGHASILTTQIYTHVVQSDLHKAHARTAPSERRQAVDVPEFNADHPSWNDKKNAPHWHAVHGTAARRKAAHDKPRKKKTKAGKNRRKE